MNADEIIGYLQKKYPGRYDDSLYKEFKQIINNNPDTNLLRCGLTNLTAYITNNPKLTIEKHSLFVDKEGINHIVSEKDWIVIGE